MPTLIFDLDTPRVRLIYVTSLLFSIALVLVKSWAAVRLMDGNLLSLDNDSLMRLVSVRNMLGGQAWFDTVEYRLMPPEGVQMHWSRYIDGVLGGLIVMLATALPMATAEVVALTIWPVALAIVLILIVGAGTRRLFGPVAASFAVLTVAIWPVTNQFYFLPGRIDHHNVQIVLIVAMTLVVLAPPAPLRSGLLAGTAAALALAIGLETLLFILGLGIVLFWRAQTRRDAVADPVLAGFSVALFGGSVLFWLGQTAPARWGVQVCDQLGTPVIVLTAIACAASLLPMVLAKDRFALRLGIAAAATVAGCAIAWPVLSPCLAGPYGSLPHEVQEIIRNGITEARPGLDYARRSPVMYVQMILPVVGALVLAVALWPRHPEAAGRTAARDRREVMLPLVVLGTIGLVASFSQIRLILMSAPAVPVLVGAVMALLVGRYLHKRGAADAALMLLAAVALVAPLLLRDVLRTVVFPQVASTSGGRQDAICRDAALMAEVDTLPPAVFLTTTNLGPVILAGTRHSTVSGPYHRSPAAFANGRVPLQLDEAAMQSYLAGTKATHLMLCAGSNYGEGFATELAGGATTDWLTPVPLDAGAIRVFAIAPVR